MTRLGLSEDEKMLGERLVAKAEARAKRWPSARWIHLSHATFWIVLGAWFGPLSAFRTEAFPDVIDQLKLRDKPSDLPTTMWAVAEVRRAAGILEGQYRLRLVEASLGLFGALAFVVGAAYAGFVLDRWNDGPRLALIAKILWAKWDEETKPQSSPGV